MARRKLVSATSRCCACWRRRVCRQVPISIQLRQHAERTDQPEQAIADHPLRGAIGLCSQHQRIAHRRHRHLVFVGSFGPGQQARAAFPRAHGVARNRIALGVEQRHRIARLHFRGHAVAQQAVDREFAQHDAREQALVEKGNVQLQHRRGVAAGRRLGEDGLAQLACQRIVALDVARAQHVADEVLLRGMHARRGIAGLEAAAVVDPRDRLQLGELAHQRFRAAREFDRIDFPVRCIARNAHQLLLALQQAQAHALLCVLDVSPHGFLLAFHFFGAQIPERRNDGGKKQQHRRDGREHGDGVLQHRRLPAPPAAPPGKR